MTGRCHHVWVVVRIAWRGGKRYRFCECPECGEVKLIIG